MRSIFFIAVPILQTKTVFMKQRLIPSSFENRTLFKHFSIAFAESSATRIR